MSARAHFPKPRISDSHFFLSLARGEKIRCLAIKPWMLYAVTLALPAVATVYLASAAYFIFRDDMLTALMKRQTEMQYAYEDRIASMRVQLDKVTSRQLLDQNSLEGRVLDLASRQAQLEMRAAVVATLADATGVSRETTASIPAANAARTLQPKAAANAKAGTQNPLLSPSAPVLPQGATSFAPVTSTAPLTGASAKPRPEELEQRSDAPGLPAFVRQAALDPDLPLDLRVGTIVQSLDRVEVAQVRAVNSIGSAATRQAARLRVAIAETGLSPDRFSVNPAKGKPSASGGPFVPLKLDPNGSPFEREVSRLQEQIVLADRLRRALPSLPLRKPLSGNPDVTSSFGGRVDPFYGRMASHTGIDFREDYGSPVRATASGKIVHAGPNGGYGNMVEIDHGNGLTTRYAHLSAVSVNEDQSVEAGTIVGKLGSTGRSTGPHLHYEVRIDGDAVDPARFLRAGQKLAGN